MGTELGAFMSCDRGASWVRLQGGLPRVAVHDLALHDRDGVLVAATHGRGFWALDVDGLRGLSKEALEAPVHLLPVGDLTRWARRSAVGGYGGGDSTWRGQNEARDLKLWVHRRAGEASIAVEIRGPGDESVALIEVPAGPGLHGLSWDGALDRAVARRRGRAPEGQYSAQLSRLSEDEDAAREPIGDRRVFTVRRDPMLDGASAAEMAAEDAVGSSERD